MRMLSHIDFRQRCLALAALFLLLCPSFLSGGTRRAPVKGPLWAVESAGAPVETLSLPAEIKPASSLGRIWLALQGRLRLRFLDAEGGMAAFASYRILSEGQGALPEADSVIQGRAFADGSAFFSPEGPGFQSRAAAAGGTSAGAFRLEASARGAASVQRFTAGSDLHFLIGPARPLPEPLPVQIVFVVDSTASMGPYFAALREAVAASLGEAAAALPRARIQAGLVFFRDEGEEYITKSLPLAEDQTELLAALRREYTDKGGDEPEALANGLSAGLDLFHSAGDGDALRLIFAFTDALPKEVPSAKSRLLDLAAVCGRAASAGVRLYTVGVGDFGPDAALALKLVAASTGAAFLRAGSREEIVAAEDSLQKGRQLQTSKPAAPAPAQLRAELSSLLARVICAEAASVRTGGSRSPALELLDAVQAKMAAKLSYPEAARRRGSEGSVRLLLAVAPDGSLSASRVSAGSGSSLLDAAALSLARSVFPLSNPSAIRAELIITVRYSLEPPQDF